MKKIDFISVAPNLAIFKTGTNQTYLGASLFLIYLIVLLVLAVIYFYDYFSQSDFSFEYTTNCKKTRRMFCILPKMMYLCMNFVT